MSPKRPILSKAEAYSQEVVRKNAPPGDKSVPYTYFQAKRRIGRQLTETISRIDTLPSDTTPNEEVVTKLTLHPSFLARSFFPKKILEKYELKCVGSKEVFITPETKATKTQEDQDVLSSSLLYVAGQKEQFSKLLDDIASDELDDDSLDDLIKLEDISLFESLEKLAPSTETGPSTSELVYEIVLHASSTQEYILESFCRYIDNLGGHVYKDKTRTVKGLTFCFVKTCANNITPLASFAYVRVVRPIPELTISEQGSDFRKIDNFSFETEKDLGSGPHSNIAIFDGGLFQDDCNNPHIRYFDLTNQHLDIEDNYLHGSRVTSAIVYGDVGDSDAQSRNILSVDHYKVYCHQDNLDVGLVDVLDRLVNVLKSRKYKFVNISLGPKVPCPDDEPSLWTSTLDELAATGETLFVVAVGNEGIYLNTDLKGLARIQPPADMLNGLSIGAANSRKEDWERASYSCVGPGRRPGYIKPDALFFGGEEDEKVKLLSLSDYSINEITGTSIAAPLTLRLAALIDMTTNGELNVATIRALLIHSTGRNDVDRKECGWGRIESNIENILYCDDNKVTFIYQGVLTKSSGIRASVPCPQSTPYIGGMIEMDATVCFYTDIDQQHTVSYTRAGLEITFRPNFEKLGKDSSEAKTRSLFNKKNILGDDPTFRRDAHLWETCYKVHDRMRASSLKEPMLDIKYLARDEGHSRSAAEMRKLPPLYYSLVVTVQTNTEYDLYSDVVNEFQLLTPLEVDLDAIVNV
ncbi:S8 family peptidase [Vibrio vulnificus]|nr:S8 family peptidase [Vibrio vulnificus]HAS8528417.1 S8 family peptidase [Vibrio vulnificus]